MKKKIMIILGSILFFIVMLVIIIVLNKNVDKVDYAFESDLEILGKWKSVDYVNIVETFSPAKKYWNGDLYLKDVTITEDGKTSINNMTWTKGFMINNKNQTANKYQIKNINNSKYLFVQWKNFNYVYFHKTPKYYVFCKEK